MFLEKPPTQIEVSHVPMIFKVEKDLVEVPPEEPIKIRVIAQVR